jgi:hypothetical protein
MPNAKVRFRGFSVNPSGDTGGHNSARCALVVVWLGRWPAWIPQFLESCEANQRFHWHIFTNIGPLPTPCTNVYVHNITLEDLRERASTLLQFPVNLQHSYKVCELKPLFGDLFADVLSPYEFWGYTDLDIIYGNCPDSSQTTCWMHVTYSRPHRDSLSDTLRSSGIRNH